MTYHRFEPPSPLIHSSLVLWLDQENFFSIKMRHMLLSFLLVDTISNTLNQISRLTSSKVHVFEPLHGDVINRWEMATTDWDQFELLQVSEQFFLIVSKKLILIDRELKQFERFCRSKSIKIWILDKMFCARGIRSAVFDKFFWNVSLIHISFVDFPCKKVIGRKNYLSLWKVGFWLGKVLISEPFC